MKILTVTTTSPTIRSEIVGWTHEDIDLYLEGAPIGMTPAMRDYHRPATIFEALWRGWNLLGPPQRMGHDDAWDWWLVWKDDHLGVP